MINAQAVSSYLHASEELCEIFGITNACDLDVQLLARGQYNENYTFQDPTSGKRFVFRVNLGSQMHLEDQITYEAHALELLASSGRTPRVYYVDDSKGFFGRGILVEEYLSGQPLCYERDLVEAAHILADIHSVSVHVDHQLFEPESPLQAIVDECEAMFSYYRSWEGADRTTIERIDRWFTVASEKACVPKRAKTAHIINTELNSGNFLINPGKKGYLIDWEKPLIGEPEQDIAHFLVPTTTFFRTDTILTKAERDQFVSQYRAAVGGRFDTEQISTRLQDYCALSCLRGITWSAMALAQHKTEERNVADALIAEKIETYMTDIFLDAIEREFYSE